MNLTDDNKIKFMTRMKLLHV